MESCVYHELLIFAHVINRSSSVGNVQGKIVGVMGAMEPEIAMLNKHVQDIETIKVERWPSGPS
jgi:hypothetical protein